MHFCGDWKHDAPLILIWVADHWSAALEGVRGITQQLKNRFNNERTTEDDDKREL